MNILQLAGMLPRDPQFRRWVSQWMVPPRDVTVDDAAAFIREVCEIESRKALADNPQAEQRFHQFLRKPYVAWRDREVT
jgi:hypothetical protein